MHTLSIRSIAGWCLPSRCSPWRHGWQRRRRGAEEAPGESRRLSRRDRLPDQLEAVLHATPRRRRSCRSCRSSTRQLADISIDRQEPDGPRPVHADDHRPRPPGAAETKPAMWVDGAIHGNEINGVTCSLYLAWYLLTRYDYDPYVQGLVDRHDLLHPARPQRGRQRLVRRSTRTPRTTRASPTGPETTTATASTTRTRPRTWTATARSR